MPKVIIRQTTPPDTTLQVNGVTEGTHVAGSTIGINLSDGTNPVTPDSVTKVGDNYEVAVPSGWVRNPQWPQFEEEIDTIQMVWGVYEGRLNGFSFIISGDWEYDYGDGTTGVGGGFEHEYDYSTINAPILVDKNGDNYKPVLIHLKYLSDPSPVLFFSINASSPYENNILDLWVNLDDSRDNNITYNISNAMYMTKCERFRTNARFRDDQTMNGRLNNMFSLRVLSLPENFFANGFSNLNAFNNSGAGAPNIVLGDLEFGVNISNAFNNCGFKKFGKLYGDDVTTCNTTFFCSEVEEIDDIDFPEATSQLQMFWRSSLRKIGTINMPKLTTYNRMFAETPVEELVFTDSSLVTNADNFVDDSKNLKRLVVPGMTRGFSIIQAQLDKDALEEFYTSLGTASGTQTLDVRFNPGTLTADHTIATAKGFTVLT